MLKINNIPHLRGGGRNSNLELLRLLSMLMILNLHSFWGYTHGDGILQAFDFLRECTSICAVNVFLLISGYFGIRWKGKSLFNLIFQLFFYAFAIYAVASLIGVIDFSWRGLLHNGKCLYRHWGFITNYLLLYLCAPLLNAFVEKVTKKQLLGFIIILFLSEWLMAIDFQFFNFCTVYLIGRFIATSGVINDTRIKAGRWYWLTTFAIFGLMYATYKYLHVTDAATMQSLFWGLDYAAPLVILQAIFVFMWFARLDFQSKVVNWLAASCLSIFLIHMHPAIKHIGYYGYTESLYSLPVLEHVWKLALLMIVVFFGSISIDKIRIGLSNLCYKALIWFLEITKINKTSILSYIPNIAKK